MREEGRGEGRRGRTGRGGACLKAADAGGVGGSMAKGSRSPKAGRILLLSCRKPSFMSDNDKDNDGNDDDDKIIDILYDDADADNDDQ